ncbi:MAG: TonB C-terminal domain-containing protein [Puniceicoccales bacterium]|jgi:hypothetical protein|nr:TonB C-terminal domain-containing protein [Puniceicoccales bacterium]
MTFENSKGWFVSLALHAALIAGLLLHSAFKPAPPEEKPPQHAALVVNLTGNGGAFGDGGGKSPAPKGRPDAPKRAEHDPVAEFARQQEKARREAARSLAKIKEQQQREAERQRQEEERRARAQTSPAPAVPTPAKPVKPADDSSRAVSVADWMRANDTAPARAQKPARPSHSGASTGAATPVVRSGGVDLSRVFSGGVENGAGAGGSRDGGGPVVAGYETKIKLLIQARWQELLDTDPDGRALGGLTGEFNLRVSRNGNISFGGWTRAPGNAHFERLLRRAIDEVGNAGARPPAMRDVLNFTITARPN